MKLSRKIVTIAVLFLLLLTFVVLTSGWHEPARLVINGRAESTEAIVDVRWDSGAGYNDYEQRDFHFVPTRGGDGAAHQIVIGKAAGKNAASSTNQVVLTELRVDGSGVGIPAGALKKTRFVSGSGWLLDSAESEIRLDLPVSRSIEITFATNNRSGIALLSFAGTQSRHDLYRKNWEILSADVNFWLLDGNGDFSVSFDLPRYPVKKMLVGGTAGTQFSSVFLESGAGRTRLPLVKGVAQESGYLLLEKPNSSTRKYFHPVQLGCQLLFSLLLTWIIWSAGRMVVGYGGCIKLFVAEKRWLFWTFFTGALAVYGLWLLAFWPGVMSVDSLNIWRSALLPEVMINNHPLLNEIWYLFLIFLWNNIAVVPIIQIVLLSALLAATFFFTFRAGVSLGWLLPCYVLLLLSVPVGLYNVTLWKDVPFALLVVFWGLVPTWLYFLKVRGRGVGNVRLGSNRIIALLLLFVALLMFRHNGLIYLFVMPLLFFSLGLLRVPRIVLICGCVAGIGLLYLVMFPPVGIKGGSYFHDLSRSYLQQIESESPVKRIVNGVRSYPRLLDIKKHQEESDFWHYYLGDRYAYWFLRQAGWSDVFKYLPPDEHPFPQLRTSALQIYAMSLEYPWLYFSWYPFWLLYLFLLSILCYRRMPLSAIFSTVILVQVFALLFFVGTVNWRYYYFVLLGGYFLLPIWLIDLHALKNAKSGTMNT